MIRRYHCRCCCWFLFVASLFLWNHDGCESFSSVIVFSSIKTNPTKKPNKQKTIATSLASSSFPSEVLEWLDEHRHQLSWKPIHEDETLQLPSQCSASSSSLLVELNPTTNTLNEAAATTTTTYPPIWLHLIPSPTRLEEVLSPQYNQHLTNTLSIGSGDRKTSGKNDSGYNNSNNNNNNRHRPKKIVHLHQDVWLQKTEICKCRLLAQLGCSPIPSPSPPTKTKTKTTSTDTTINPPRRIFARKTIAKRINATIAMDFLDQHHLWGATRAKYYYGLFWKRQYDDEDLVAVATFSARRKVQRDGQMYRSHELLRYCAQKDKTVVGGISKLVKNFQQDTHADDLVTVVDRDWGDGSGWHSMGFETVQVLDPIVMVVSQNTTTHKKNHNSNSRIRRHHLVGAGIGTTRAKNRLGLPTNVLRKLDLVSSAQEALQCLAKNGFYPVYDCGVERLFKVFPGRQESSPSSPSLSAMQLWERSQPKYADRYYSENTGITLLLQHAAGLSSRSPNINESSNDGKEERAKNIYDKEETEVMASWRATSGTARSAKLMFSAPSSLANESDNSNNTMMVEVRERSNGWRTVGVVGGSKISSIYHGIYKVSYRNDDGEGKELDASVVVEPTVVVSEFIKTMAALALTATTTISKTRREEPKLRFLHYGYGAGTLIRLLAYYLPTSQHVAIELDEGVVKAANIHPLPSNVQLIVGDALDFTTATQQSQDETSGNNSESLFDCVCIDVFDEDLKVPLPFYSSEFLLQLASNRLSPNGIVIQNFHSGGKKRALELEVATQAYADAFEEYIWVDALDSQPHAGNKILLAFQQKQSKTPTGQATKDSLLSNAKDVQEIFNVNFDVSSRVEGLKRESDGIKQSRN